MAANVGMVGTTANHRPSFLRYLISLYKSDVTFRSAVDFTAVGTIVLLFLFFAPTRQSNTGGTNSNVSTAQKPPTDTKQSQPPPDTKAATPPSASKPVTAPTAVAIPFPPLVTSPSIANFVVVDIDETVFRNSAPADQSRLAAAARAFRAEQFADITKVLAEANAADPNVAFMRAMAFVNLGGDDVKPAEPLLRAASNGGVRQASILLGRMLVRPPAGVTKDVELGRRLIETAAAGGDRLAQRLAGIAYLTNDFGGVNPAKARELFRSAAQAGDATAMLFYSLMLGMALGGPADQPAAADLLRRSAAGGLTVAQQTIGNWLLEEFKRNVIDDPREGIEWLETAYKKGQSIFALQSLVVFYAGPSTPAPWRDKSKGYDLARLCSGVRNPWCHAENGWMYQFGVGTNRDLAKAFAHYQVAVALGYADAAKSLQGLDGQLKPDEESAAIALSQTIRTSLKPAPVPWPMQYVGVQPPPALWAEARYAAAPEPAPSTAANAPAPANPGVAPGNTPSTAAPNQQANAQAPASAPWVPLSRRGSTTLKRIVYAKSGAFSGNITRLSATEWVGEWTAEGGQGVNITKYVTVLETLSELVLRNIATQDQLKADLTGRQMRVRRGANWEPHSEISSIEPAKPVMRLPVPDAADENFADNLDRYVDAPNEKAFAVNERLRFSWTSGRKTPDEATAEVLKRCGADCKLYALGDNLAK